MGSESVVASGTHFDCDAMVVGLARNCARTIEAAVQGFKAAMPPFRAIHWYIVESDSDDETVAVLNRLRKSVENFGFVSLGRLADSLPLRTARLAVCRNRYLDEVQAGLKIGQLGYVFVADLDGINPLVSQAALSSCWSRDGWDVCTANQAGPYYDIFALRHPEWCPGDCVKELDFLRRHGRSWQSAALAAVYAKMIRIPAEADWIEVESAFGGLAVYRAEVLANASYVGLCDDGSEVCEHVTLHQQIRTAGGRTFINPAMINAGTTEHSQYWADRAQAAAETSRPLFRAFIRTALGREKRRAFRRMIESAS